jgi:hypothetical protein
MFSKTHQSILQIALSLVLGVLLFSHAGLQAEEQPLPQGEGDLTAAAGPGVDESAHSSLLFSTEEPIPLAAPQGMTDPSPPPMPPVTDKPSQSVTVNLIAALVKKGILTQAEAGILIQQAEADAARAQAEASANDSLAVDGDTVRVTYVPESVKAEIRDQLRTEVLAQARDEGWVAANKQPEWVSRVKIFGDVRLRYEGIFFPEGTNDNTGSFPNFNAINTGSPFDVSGTEFSPQHNVDQERMRLRLRARLGFDVNLEEGFSVGMRIATGDSNSPTSTNQTFGGANQGQGGNFSKYSLWLDRGFIKYEIGGGRDRALAPETMNRAYGKSSFSPEPVPGSISQSIKPSTAVSSDFSLAFLFGRFDNPFFTTSQIMWDEDVGFDGVAVQLNLPVVDGFSIFLNGGAFPIFNTDYNFSSNQPAKFESEDKWLYAGQIGFDLKPSKTFNAKVGAAYYDFNSVEGRRSTPYTPITNRDASDADNSRPSYAQKGNTYMAIRDIIPSALNNFGTTQQFQYFGLASPFKVAAYTAKVDFNHFEPFQVSLRGEYAVNMDYNSEMINEIAINNRGPLPIDESGVPTGVGEYEGGDTAWNVEMQVGKAAFEKFGDWNLSVGYRYVESDAVVDAFADSDFNVGGTNVKGYTIGAALALSQRVRVGVRWMGATQIAGPPLKTDVVLFDLSAKF